jgi:hypothetical protein
MSEKSTITLDGKEYKLDDLSDKQKQIINNMSHTSRRLNELSMKVAECQAAMLTYKRMFEKEETDASSKDNT